MIGRHANHIIHSSQDNIRKNGYNKNMNANTLYEMAQVLIRSHDW